jgi:hypothetical protein
MEYFIYVTYIKEESIMEYNEELNKEAINCIESEYIRNYLIETGHKFSEKEQVIIIVNSKLSLDDKIKVLRKYGDAIHGDIDVTRKELIQLRDMSRNTFNDNVLLVEDIDGTTKAAGKMWKIKEFIKDGKINLSRNVVRLVDYRNITDIAEFELNDDLEIIKFKINSGKMHDTLIGKYVEIPHGLKVGDKVTEIDSEEIYIVVNTDVNPINEDIGLASEDAKILVLPEWCIKESNKSSAEAIEEDIRKQIKNIESVTDESSLLDEPYRFIRIDGIIKV